MPPVSLLMPSKATLNVSLTPELNAFIAAKVATGRYRSASEVVRAALRLLEKQNQTEDPGQGKPAESKRNAR